LMVLEAFYKISAIPQILVDIYINYDCDINMSSLFELIVFSVSKLAIGADLKPPCSNELNVPPLVGSFSIAESPTEAVLFQDRALRAKALRVLVIMCSSLNEWVTVCNTPFVLSPSKSDYDKKETSQEDSKKSVVFTNKNHLNTVVLKDSSRTHSFSNRDAPEHNKEGQMLENFENIKNKKSIIKQGVQKFNSSPSKGIHFLIENGHLTDDKSVVHFLRNTPELNKTAIGEYLGDGKE
jgi:brefeldin A-inhibited guanine nucleotide-exchange protein